MKRIVIGLSLMAACLMLVPPVQATQLTYILEGTITHKNDPSGLVDLISVGDEAVYTILIDSDALNQTGVQGWGWYVWNSANLKIGTNTFPCEARQIEIIADWSNSPQSSFRAPISTTFAGSPGGGYFGLTDRDKQAIQSSALPSIPYDFAPFDSRALSLTITNPNVYGDYSSILGSFDRFTIIPEPASLWLLSCAALFSCWRRFAMRIL